MREMAERVKGVLRAARHPERDNDAADDALAEKPGAAVRFDLAVDFSEPGSPGLPCWAW